MLLDYAIFFVLYMIAMLFVLLGGSFIYFTGLAVINHIKRKKEQKAQLDYLTNLDKNLSRRFDKKQ